MEQIQVREPLMVENEKVWNRPISTKLMSLSFYILSGVTKQVGDALMAEGQQRSGRVVSIGIAPWGIVERNHELLGHNRDVPCHSISSPRQVSLLLSNLFFFLSLFRSDLFVTESKQPTKNELLLLTSAKLPFSFTGANWLY